MILFLTLLWVAALALGVKLGWIKLNLWWKLSPLFWSVFLLIALFIPLQFWAPSGSLIAGNYTVAIIPQVAGEVVAVNVKANQPVQMGDTLFQIDATPYQAALDEAQASLELAKIRVQQEQSLSDKGVGKALDLDRARAQLAQSQARVDRAAYNLRSTTVTAPANGYVTNLNLRPGATALTMPFAPAMSFVDTSESIVGGFVMQNHLRYIEPGQQVEVALKMYPGQVFRTEVDAIVPARATGLEQLTGSPLVAQNLAHAPFAVRLKMSDELKALRLPSGATGRMVIYSGKGAFAHVIRRVEIRIEAIMNYINPF